MEELEAALLSIHDDSDWGMINIHNETFKENIEYNKNCPSSQIAYIVDWDVQNGHVASNGQLKTRWLTAAHEFAKSSNSTVTLRLVRAYSNCFQEHKVEVARGRAIVTCVSEIAKVFENSPSIKLGLAADGIKISLTEVAGLLRNFDKLIYAVELF